MSLRVNADRLRNDLTTLGEIGRLPGGGISRTAFSPADAQARQWYRDRCEQAGLQTVLDGLGNMITHAAGADLTVPAVWSGSHIDTVPNGGAFDGALGTVAALECLRRLSEEGVPLRRPVRALVFSDEEGNYSHLLGSYGMVHGYDAEFLGGLTGRDGDRLLDTLAAWPWTMGAPTEVQFDPASIDSMVELHIEQGPHLEAGGVQIGVVTSIVGIGGGVGEFRGRADHAGTTPMNARKDALRAAADLLVRVPDVAAAVSPDAVITCGLIDVEPGGSNVVPGTATLTFDFRDRTLELITRLGADIAAAIDAVAAEHGLVASWRPDEIIPPVALDSGVQQLVRASAEALGLSNVAMPSGAGHDSQNLAPIVPTGMIFVPSKDGRSHSPAEHTEWADIENGANVLLATLLELASR